MRKSIRLPSSSSLHASFLKRAFAVSSHEWTSRSAPRKAQRGHRDPWLKIVDGQLSQRCFRSSYAGSSHVSLSHFHCTLVVEERAGSTCAGGSTPGRGS